MIRKSRPSRILDARTSGVAFKASRISSGMENVT